MRKTLMTCALVSGAMLQALPAKAQSDDWATGLCLASIEDFVSDMSHTVDRLRVKVGDAPEGAVVVELGSPDRYDEEPSDWSRQLNLAPGELVRATVSIMRGGWISFRRGGGNESELGIFVEEGGQCRLLQTETVSTADLPESTRASFERYDRLSVDQGPPDIGVGSAVWPAGLVRVSDLPKVCLPYAQAMRNPAVAPLAGRSGNEGPVLSAGEDGDQMLLNNGAMSERVIWSALASDGKGWALFDKRTVDGVDQFHVQYIFEDGAECSVFPERSQQVSVVFLPGEVVGYYLSQVGADTTGSLPDLRGRLQAVITGNSAATPSAGSRRPVRETVIAAPTPRPAAEPPLTAVPSIGLAVSEPPDVEMDATVLGGQALRDYVRKLPSPILKRLGEWQNTCKENGDEDVTVSDQFATKLDFDGDGDLDWVTNGDQIFCVAKDGETSMIGGGNGATNIAIVMMTSRGAVEVANKHAQGGSLKRFDGFAVFGSYEAISGESNLLLRRGTAQEVDGMPKGGEIVYELSR